MPTHSMMLEPPTEPGSRSKSAGRVFAEPVLTLRTFETAVAHIISAIERAQLREGDRLPNESVLAAQLGISRPTLRQALRVLERSGSLVVKRGKAGGIFVASDYLPTDAITTSIAYEEANVRDVLRARRLLETAAVEEAVRNADEDDYREIARTLDLLRAPHITSAQILRADMMFHRAIIRAAKNRFLEEALGVVYRHLAPVRDAYQVAEDADLVLRLHRRQFQAMRSGDASVLRRALDTHFRYLEARVEAGSSGTAL